MADHKTMFLIPENPFVSTTFHEHLRLGQITSSRIFGHGDHDSGATSVTLSSSCQIKKKNEFSLGSRGTGRVLRDARWTLCGCSYSPNGPPNLDHDPLLRHPRTHRQVFHKNTHKNCGPL